MINAPYFEPRSLRFSIDLRARDAFFAHRVTGTSKCWAFLKQYYNPADSPDYLTLAIDAVSLAYLWHEVRSDAVLTAARERYISALSKINKALKSRTEATQSTALLTSLLFDLFEKITYIAPQNARSWTSHINGGLALVSLRGYEQFQNPLDFSVLVRLSGHFLISCVASASPIPDELIAIRAYLTKHLRPQDPMWRLSDLLILYGDLRSGIQRGIFSEVDRIGLTVALDEKLQALDLSMPPSWQYSTTILDHKSDRTFDFHFDSYPSLRVSQVRNQLRIIRVLLNESLLQYYIASSTAEKSTLKIRVVHDSIKTLVHEICASVPDYLDCEGAARHRLPTSEKAGPLDDDPDPFLDRSQGESGHPHTPRHHATCYALIFPLYVAGVSRSIPEARSWSIKQLQYMSSHFSIRNATMVAQILEGETYVSPWKVYDMLGSYATGA
jgi:hypothetical protein